MLFIFFAVQIWFFYLTFNFSVHGILLEKNTEGQWVIDHFDTTNIADKAGLMIGDVILSVNGIEADNDPTIRRWKSIEQSDTVQVQRGGETIQVDTGRLKNPTANDILSLLAEACSLLIAYILSVKSSNSKSAAYLSGVFLVIGIIFMSLGASIRGDILGKSLISTFMILLPIVFYHFIAVFLSEKGYYQLPMNFLKRIYPATLGVLVAFICLYLPYSTANTFYRINIFLTLSVTILGMLWNFLILLNIYLKHRKQHSFISLILKTITISLILSLAPIMMLSFIPQILFGREWVDPFYMSWFIFILPLTFAYLFVAKKLYDIDMIVRRILFTGLIALVPSVVFTVLIKLLFPADSTAERLTIVFMLFVTALTLILYSLENITSRLEPIIFQRKYRLKDALKKIAKNLGAISSLREMKEIILIDIIHTLEVNGGAIVFQYQDHIECISEGSIDTSRLEHLLAVEPERDSQHSIFEISSNEEYSSYVIITDRKNRSRLNSEEINWLNLIITYLAVSLENIHLLRKLTVKLERLASQLPDEESAYDIAWFRKLMFELQEKERTRIATDLHDTTMQDLFFLKNRLRSLLEKYSFYYEDRSSIEGLMEYIDIINTNLRQSCFELHPYLLQEIGLVQTIRKLIDLESLSSPFEIDFAAKGNYLLEQVDPETKRHLFRLVQELINNAKKHSQASRLLINLSAGSYGISFSYEDDGIGFEPRSAPPSEIGGAGIGMEQMKSRIISMNGKYEIVTAAGKGMKFKAAIPLKEGRTA